MDAPLTANPSIIKENKQIEIKEYEMNIEQDTYKLKITIYTEQTINFNIRQTNIISAHYYEKEHTYGEIINILILMKNHYDDITKILNFIDKAIARKDITLNKEQVNQEKSKLILLIKRKVDYEEMKSQIELVEKDFQMEEMLTITIDEINKIKKNHTNNNENNKKQIPNIEEDRIKSIEDNIKKIEDQLIQQKQEIMKVIDEKIKLSEVNRKKEMNLVTEKIDQLIKRINGKEREINLLDQKIIILEKEKKEMSNNIQQLKYEIQEQAKIIEKNKQYIQLIEKEKQQYRENQEKIEMQKKEKEEKFKEEQKKIKEEQEKLKEEQKKLKEEHEKLEEKANIQFKDIPFTQNPQYLKYTETIANNNSCGGFFCNFDVFKGLKDNIEYLIYNNNDNYNIEIMKIYDKTIVISLKGHNNRTRVIRYYIKDNKEEYILSCDNNKLVIIWDIQNNYNKKYSLQVKYSGHISDALLLFNIFNKNYILLSSNNNIEFSKLYEFTSNTPFIRNIYGTNQNNIFFMIPWQYKNKYYIIDCCNNKISINNFLEDECYANLTTNSECSNLCGYIYKDNYLCLSDYNSTYIIIWDLINKIIYKKIEVWGINGREIIGWNDKYAIVGIENGIVIINIEEEKVKKIEINNTYVYGVKKMKISKLGECLILSDSKKNIKLFSI